MAFFITTTMWTHVIYYQHMYWAHMSSCDPLSVQDIMYVANSFDLMQSQRTKVLLTISMHQPSMKASRSSSAVNGLSPTRWHSDTTTINPLFILPVIWHHHLKNTYINVKPHPCIPSILIVYNSQSSGWLILGQLALDLYIVGTLL